MIRRPPTSTPFPTRRSSDLGCEKESLRREPEPAFLQSASDIGAGPNSRVPRDVPRCLGHLLRFGPRSEEHTSELQSHSDLVCRLLLEKKNKKKKQKICRKRN